MSTASTSEVSIAVLLNEQEARCLALFISRATYLDFFDRASSDLEAMKMQAGANKVRQALTKACGPGLRRAAS